MKSSIFLKTLLATVVVSAIIAGAACPGQAGKKKTKKTTKKSHSGTAIYYITPPEENLRGRPGGQRIGSLTRGTPVTVTKTKGNWAYVTVKAWVWKPSLSKFRPKLSSELLVKNVDGVFKKNQFIIKGVLVNQTKAAFGKVVLQGELFKGKKRIAHKSLTLFSKKKPLPAGKKASFSIVFKRTRGFDSYSVRILKAVEK